jgi:hypothetical protein
MAGEIDPGAIRLWVERLREGTIESRINAASELSRYSVRTRGSVRCRGSISDPAESRFPEDYAEEALEVVLKALRDENPALRREVAFALGEFGDNEAAKVLSEMVNGETKDPDKDVRRSCIAALKTIGGRVAVEAIRKAAEKDAEESVRYEALDALAELAAGAGTKGLQREVAYTAPNDQVRFRGAIRTRGGVSRSLPSAEEWEQAADTARTRGGVPRIRGAPAVSAVPAGGSEAARIADTLRRIAAKKGEEGYLRDMARNLLEDMK